MRAKHTAIALILPLALLSASCGDDPADPGAVIDGRWGADHVELVAAADGMQVEYDCAHGATDGPLVLDGGGAFAVAGTYTLEGGPVDVNDPPVDHPALYRGRILAGQLMLTVTLTGDDTVLGPYLLGRGVRGVLHKCY